MPSADLFEPRDEAELRSLLTTAKQQQRSVGYRETFALAVDYLEERQLDDVESELSSRYERTQTGDRGGRIAPQVIPLTSRYIDEAATSYAKPVTRRLLRPDGTEDEENTAALQTMLADADYDGAMLRMEQYTVLLKSCGMWYQARGGKLRPQVVWPHLIEPVLPDDEWASVSDQADYAGFALELYRGEHDAKAHRSYAWSEPAQVAFYSGADPYTPDSGGVSRYDNPFRWPQTVDAGGMTGATKTLPLQMLAVANDRLPVGELIIDNDPAVVLANRELNLQLSILLDTLAHQGWATLMLNLMNPESPPTTFSAGPRNGLSLGAGEGASLLSSPVNYTDLVTVLQGWVRMLAMTMSQSPNDFSAQAQAAASGFAKLVDSLPKVESRRRRIGRWRRFERMLAWPRLAAIGDAHGVLKGGIEYLAGLTLAADFQPLEFPESVPERVQRETHELEHGLTTPAKILSKQTGATEEQAAEEIAANLGQDDADAGADASAAVASTSADIQRTVLAGGQVTSLQGIVMAVATGELPRSSGVEIIRVAFQLPASEAETIVGQAGKGGVGGVAGKHLAPSPSSPTQQPTQPPAPAPAPEPPRRPSPGELVGQLIGGKR